jgi:hypothetical protein
MKFINHYTRYFHGLAHPDKGDLYHSLSSSRTGKSVSGRYYRVSSGYNPLHEKSFRKGTKILL